MKQNVFVVIPTIRTLSFLEEWGDAFKGTNLIIAEDHETKKITPPTEGFQNIYQYAWENIKKDFGKDEWIFSRKNAGIRSYGFWKAYTLGADIVITMDDDCYPVDRNIVEQHLNNLHTKAPEGWFPTFPDRRFVYTRGFPYSVRDKRKVVISHGLWTNKIDLDGINQKKYPKINIAPYPSVVQFVPPGQYFPMCSMNLAFTREAIPLMYFPLMGFDPEGNPWGYDRFDDIWAGVFAKKICDHLHLSVVNGSPFVEHRKASNAEVNIQKEKTGIAINETLWKAVDAVSLTQNTPALCYIELAQKIQFPKEPYFKHLHRAMETWGNMF
jgi:reversibly glycosylated polypeptide / UDP-arabinopyranose mutase